MKDNENVINLGEYTIPSSWDELSLKQLQDVERYYEDKERKFDIREVIELFTNHTREEVDQLPVEFMDKILEKLLWLQEKPEWGEPTNKVKLSGETYIVNIQEKLKVGEFIAVDTVLKSDKHNYAAMLAILCRKEGEVYDSKFENEALEERIKMWENASVMKVMPLVSFFFNCYIASQVHTQLSSEVREEIKFIQESIKNSRKNGELSERSTKRLMKELKKLEKSINSI